MPNFPIYFFQGFFREQQGNPDIIYIVGLTFGETWYICETGGHLTAGRCTDLNGMVASIDKSVQHWNIIRMTTIRVCWKNFIKLVLPLKPWVKFKTISVECWQINVNPSSL